MHRTKTRLLAGSLLLLAATAACGGGAAPTPTSLGGQVSGTTPQATPTATASEHATPTDSQQDNGPTPAVPTDADYFTMNVKSGPIAGTYVGSYHDTAPLCQQLPTMFGAFQALFVGKDESGKHNIQFTLAVDPAQPDQLLMGFSVSSPTGTQGYAIDTTQTPPEGSATAVFGLQGAATTVKVSGAAVDGDSLTAGPQVEATLVCHLPTS